ncbi:MULTISPECIES: hypothetical protein [Glaesserella]|uniref:YubB ferredoxin-like domain-containing protein n=1 Tax=Glaesserella australis TaxID=2094024 RepID=A0A328BV79_9PAST|nr:MULTISPECIES: hypothetical protein [Glaesserella]AUI65855.1 hypothetical protein CJD39_04380 [Glaesserella sp. 15-184]RAL17999.1 hypothetical protein C5N92_10200 [Glaesserella australis]
MPNWCQNKLHVTCHSEQMEQVKTKLFTQNDNGQWLLDFNLMVPMSESLYIESGSSGDKAMRFLTLPKTKRINRALLQQYINTSQVDRIYAKAKHHRWKVGDFIHWLKARPDEQKMLWLDLTLGEQYLSNLNQYGYKDWYDWSIANWGCKWNVHPDNCQVVFEEDSIYCLFDTPWGPPDRWFGALCAAFPEIEFTLSFFESGMWFAGEFVADMDGSFYQVYKDDDEIRQFAEDVFDEEFICDDD